MSGCNACGGTVPQASEGKHKTQRHRAWAQAGKFRLRLCFCFCLCLTLTLSNKKTWPQKRRKTAKHTHIQQQKASIPSPSAVSVEEFASGDKAAMSRKRAWALVMGCKSTVCDEFGFQIKNFKGIWRYLFGFTLILFLFLASLIFNP